MNNSYLLVICLLAASFTGCLGSDDIEPSIVKEEDTIEPVGTGDNGGNETNNYNETNHYFYNNDTYYVNGTDYLELISQVENLTVSVEELTTEVKELTEVLEEMQSSKYDVPENSSIWIYENDYDNRDWEIIKNGSTITFEYRGMNMGGVLNDSAPRNCTVWIPSVNFFREDGVQIASISGNIWTQDGGEWKRDDVEIIRECELAEWADDTNVIEQYWSTIIITLPEEPARVQAHSQYLTFY
jgi:hypothetical protein